MLALVKSCEKRIRFRLDHTLRIQALGQDAGQRALAHSDGALHCNVAGQLEEIRHGFAIFRKLQDSSDGAGRQLREELTGEIERLSHFAIGRL